LVVTGERGLVVTGESGLVVRGESGLVVKGFRWQRGDGLVVTRKGALLTQESSHREQLSFHSGLFS
jgi:hypothetical protein